MGTRPLIAVFGGSGFLGRFIVRRLAEAGMDVRVVARNPATIGAGETYGRIESRPADIRDEAAVRAALDGADGAVNAVSLYVETRHARFDAVHVDGAERLARLTGEAGLRTLVHISGIGVDTASPSAYVRARARGEDAVRAAFPAAVILRPSVIFGPGDAFLSTLASIARAPVIPLFGAGRMQLQPVHVDDVARAVVRAVDEPATRGRVFELGGAEILSYREILQAVLEHSGRRRPLLPVPFPVWHLIATLAAVLPQPPLTRDQLILMKADNTVRPDAATFRDLDITPRALTTELGNCLS